MKRVILIIVIASIFGLFGGCGSAYDFEYIDNGDGTCKIARYNGNQTEKLNIPEKINGLTVTAIHTVAFYERKDLKNITIPESVTAIGYGAFSECGSLTSIEVSEQNSVYSSLDGVLFNKDKSVLIAAPKAMKKENYAIPSSVTAMEYGAFSMCSNLTGNITIPESVTKIGDSTFEGCSGLTGVTIPESVTVIKDAAFYNCGGITSITIPASVAMIRDGAFSKCASLASIEVSEQNLIYSSLDGILFTKDKSKLIQAPEGIRKENYVIPNGVTTIKHDAFVRCGGLTGRITIPESVTAIEQFAFSESGLTSAEFLGDAPTGLTVNLFDNCADDFKIIYDPAKEGWSTPRWNGYPAYPTSH